MNELIPQYPYETALLTLFLHQAEWICHPLPHPSTTTTAPKFIIEKSEYDRMVKFYDILLEALWKG